MTKIDYISGTEEAYLIDDRIEVQVSGPVESKTSIGVLVDLHFSLEGICTSASRLEWFPKKLCILKKVEKHGQLPSYFLKAPKWLLKKHNVSVP
jgi:hypothetical protein